MSWLAEALDDLREASRKHAVMVGDNSSEDERQAVATELQEGVVQVVQQLGELDGVTPEFACQGDEVLEKEGFVPDFDHLSTTTRSLRGALDVASESFRLGGRSQTVLVSAEHMLAPFSIGDITLSVLPPTGGLPRPGHESQVSAERGATR
jgi:hypothetical protein